MLKTCVATGLQYLCITKRRNWRLYTGSGVYWKRHLKAHGGKFNTTLLFESDDYQAFVERCIQVSAELNVVESDKFANLKPEHGYDDLQSYWAGVDGHTAGLIFQRRSNSLKQTHRLKGHRPMGEHKLMLARKYRTKEYQQLRLSVDWKNRCCEHRLAGIRARRVECGAHDDSNRSRTMKALWADLDADAKAIKQQKMLEGRLAMDADARQRRKEKIQGLHKAGVFDDRNKRLSIDREGIGNPNAVLWEFQNRILTTRQLKKEVGGDFNRLCLEGSIARKSDIAERVYEQLTCPHCGKQCSGKPSSFKRWHFDNCKERT